MAELGLKKNDDIVQNTIWFKRKDVRLRILQYTGAIIMVLSLMAIDGKIFTIKLSIDQDILTAIAIAGAAVMFQAYYKRKMISDNKK